MFGHIQDTHLLRNGYLSICYIDWNKIISIIVRSLILICVNECGTCTGEDTHYKIMDHTHTHTYLNYFATQYMQYYVLHFYVRCSLKSLPFVAETKRERLSILYLCFHENEDVILC